MKKNFIIGFVSGFLITSLLTLFLKPKKKKEGDFWKELKERIKLDSHLMNIGDKEIYNLVLLYQPYSGSKYTKIVRSNREELQEVFITPIVSATQITSDADTLTTMIENTYKEEAKKLDICIKIDVSGEKECIPSGNKKLYTKHIEVTRLR